MITQHTLPLTVNVPETFRLTFLTEGPTFDSGIALQFAGTSDVTTIRFCNLRIIPIQDNLQPLAGLA